MKLLSMKEVGELLGLSTKAVQRLRDAGKIPPPLRIGRSIRFRAAEIDAWILDGAPHVYKVGWKWDGKGAAK